MDLVSTINHKSEIRLQSLCVYVIRNICEKQTPMITVEIVVLDPKISLCEFDSLELILTDMHRNENLTMHDCYRSVYK